MNKDQLAYNLSLAGQQLMQTAQLLTQMASAVHPTDNEGEVEEVNEEPVTAPKRKRGRPKKVEQSVVEKVEESPEQDNVFKSKKTLNIPQRTKRTKKTEFGTGVNKFVDDGSLFANERVRAQPRMYHEKRVSPTKEFTCTVCGYKEKKNPNLVQKEEYRCDECVLAGKAVK